MPHETAKIGNVWVIGSGTMGSGIAEVCAQHGLAVTLADVHEHALKSAITRIEGSLAKAVAKGKLTDEKARSARAHIKTATSSTPSSEIDLIIEAVPEDMALKKRIVAETTKATPKALFGSNTSSLSVTEIATAGADPTRVVGLHFFNPPPVMPLLEIVRAEQTSDTTLEAAQTFAAAIGKTAIIVRDVPGFATSRLGIILGMEAIRMLESGVASAEDIDRAMELGYKHPMGPLRLTDLVGLDVRLAIADHLTKEIGPQFAPPPLLRRLVRAGKLGKKSGEGFYKWSES